MRTVVYTPAAACEIIGPLMRIYRDYHITNIETTNELFIINYEEKRVIYTSTPIKEDIKLTKEQEQRIKNRLYYLLYAVSIVFVIGLMSFLVGGTLFALNTSCFHFSIRWYWFASVGAIIGLIYSLTSKTLKKDLESIRKEDVK